MAWITSKRLALSVGLLNMALIPSSAVSDTATNPQYQLSSDNRLLALSNMYPGSDCTLAQGAVVGTVVRRDFARDQLRITGFVLEEENGVRSFINVEPDLKDASMVTLQWVTQGLQQLVRVGRKVSVRVRQCGAAGRVMMVDRIAGVRQ